MRSGYRLVWVQCWGVPLEVWDIGNIRKIVAAVFFFFLLSKNRMLFRRIVPEVLERYMFKVTEYLVLVYSQNQAIVVAGNT